MRRAAREIERFVDESPSGSENLLRALRAWPDDGEPLLYATSDLPYVTPRGDSRRSRRAFRRSARRCARGASPTFTRRFPDAPPSSASRSPANASSTAASSCFPHGSADKLAAIATRFFDARKRPWRMASLVSPLVLIRFLLQALERRRSRRPWRSRVLADARRARFAAARRSSRTTSTRPSEYRYACAHG